MLPADLKLRILIEVADEKVFRLASVNEIRENRIADNFKAKRYSERLSTMKYVIRDRIFSLLALKRHFGP